MKQIKNPGIEQFLHENQTWDRALDFYLQENAFLKTRLAQVVEDNINAEVLEQAEQFQNDFIHNDEFIKDMQKDIFNMHRSLKALADGKDADKHKMMKQQTKLRNEMEHFEKGFSRLKNRFNQYLVSLLHD